jgi:hypothetical protein
MSNRGWQDARMKNLFQRLLVKNDARLIATFGQARLVATPKGRVELRGGSHEDIVAAREWISLFMHEAVPVRVP